jgi:hypothetical protein
MIKMQVDRSYADWLLLVNTTDVIKEVAFDDGSYVKFNCYDHTTESGLYDIPEEVTPHFD